MTNYPGVVSRNDLVAFLKQTGLAAAIEASDAWNAKNACNLSAEQNQTLNDSYYLHLGRQQAMREISEWAVKHVGTEFVSCNDECIGTHYHPEGDQ